MSRLFKEYTIWDAVTPQAVTSSTDATPIVVTKNGHGYSTGDKVIINGHTTNVAANGIFKITVLTANTFSLQNPYTNADVAGSGAGAGAAGIVAIAPAIVTTKDWRNMVISVETSGSANFTAKIAGSLGKLEADSTGTSVNIPNFGGTQSKTNPYSFIQIFNLDTEAAIDGATGVTTAGTDLHNSYEVNFNVLKYVTIVPTAWSAGTITIKAVVSDNQ